MKILYVISNPDLNPQANTGYGRHIRETVLNLERLGNEVHMFSAHHRGLIDAIESRNTAPSPVKCSYSREFVKKVLPKVVWQTLRDIQQIIIERKYKGLLFRHIKGNQIDVVFERSSYLSAAAMAAASKCKLPYYLEINSPFVEQRIKFSGKSWLNSLAKRKEVIKGQYMARGYCVSKVLVDYYVKEYDYLNNKLRSIPNAVDESWLSRSTGFKTADDTIVVGFVGSILDYHGVDMLIDAFETAFAEVPSLRLLIVGDGYMLRTYKKQVATSGIDKYVVFTGAIPYDRVSEQIDKMDICVNPKHSWYGSPIKLFEYGAMKKAIIASNEAPIAEVIKNGVEGLLVEPNPNALSKAIVQLATDKQTRETLAASFHERVKNEHTWAKNIELIQKDLVSL